MSDHDRTTDRTQSDHTTTTTTTNTGGNGGMAFVLGAIVIVVAALVWFLFAGADVDGPGTNDVNISVETPANEAGAAVEGAADGAADAVTPTE